MAELCLKPSSVSKVWASFKNDGGAWDEEEDREPESTIITDYGRVIRSLVFDSYEEEKDKRPEYPKGKDFCINNNF